MDVLPVEPLVCSLTASSLLLHSAPLSCIIRDVQASVPGDHPHGNAGVADCWRMFVHLMLWVLLLWRVFVCLFCFLMEVVFIISSGPILGSRGGIESLSGLLLIFLLRGEKC